MQEKVPSCSETGKENKEDKTRLENVRAKESDSEANQNKMDDNKKSKKKTKKDINEKKGKRQQKRNAIENSHEEPPKKKQDVENTKEYIKDNKNGIIKHEIKEETNESKENKTKDKHIQFERKDNEIKQNKEVSSLSKKKKKSRKSNKERQKARGCFIGQIPLLDKDMKDSAKNKLANVETVLKKHFEVLELPLPIRIRLLTVPQTSEFRGMAFCDFKTKEESDTVIEKMHHTTFGTARNKKRINVESLTLDKETMRKTYEDKIDAIIEKYKMCDNFVYWEQNGDNGGTGYESIGGSGHKNRWETNNDLKIGETKSILENDPGLKKFLYSVSLHCAESTLQEASTLVDKFPKKCKDFNTTLRDEKCKYLMGMLKQRC